MNHPIPCKIHWQLDELLLPYTIDNAIYHKIDNPEIIEHIESVGIVFYKKIA